MANAQNPLRLIRQKSTIANANRTSFRHDEWKGIRLQFTRAAVAGGVAFMLWFLACCSYLYGSLYGSTNRRHNMHVLALDYDGGIVGKSMLATYQQLQSPQFITLEFHSPAEYPTADDVFQSVRRGDYWGAIYSNEGASKRLSAAIQGGQAATTYNQTNALTYVWNQQYYAQWANSVVLAGLQQLVAGTRVAYTKLNGTQAYPFVNQSNPAAVQAFLNPITAAVQNIKADPHGSVVLFNTVSMAMPILQQFFFLLVLNGVSRQYQLYNKMTVHSSMLVRRVAGLLFSLGASLCQAGYFWAFRETWNVNGVQFVLTWMTLWLLMHVHYTILDTISALAPLPFMPFAMLLWIFVNIGSTLSPLELQAGFYHWGISLPSHNAYSVMVTVWTSGGDNRLYRALPILFAWWVLGNITTSIAHVRASHLAYKAAREEKGAEMRTKDEERAISSAQEYWEALSRQTTRLEERERTVEEEAMEQRQIYGPSIPPLA